MASNSPSPADVLALKVPTDAFMCPITANTFGIDFLAFKIRDMSTGKCVFEVAKDENAPAPEYPPNFDLDQLRSINYKFPAEFLRYRTVGTTLRFKVGPQPVRNFRMIERHYFKNRLIQSYDFNFTFCIPNSTNEWESIYDMPVLSEAEVAEIIASPEQTKSDSFYFVEGQLIMHNKATYTYVDDSESRSSPHPPAAAPASVAAPAASPAAAAVATSAASKHAAAAVAPTKTAAAPAPAAAAAAPSASVSAAGTSSAAAPAKHAGAPTASAKRN